MTTAFTTEKWRHQHLVRPDWLAHYWASRDRVSRDAVLMALESLRPFKTVMELGCNVGPMMARVALAFPGAEVRGIDPNPVAVEHARVPGVSLGDLISWLPAQPSNSWDVILTHYTLAYGHPDEMPAIVSQCLRVASRGVVFAEPTGPTKMIFDYPEWRHPYGVILSQFGAREIKYAEIPNPPDHLNMVTVGMK